MKAAGPREVIMLYDRSLEVRGGDETYRSVSEGIPSNAPGWMVVMELFDKFL